MISFQRINSSIALLALAFLSACGNGDDRKTPGAPKDLRAVKLSQYTDITDVAPAGIRKDLPGYYRVGESGHLASVIRVNNQLRVFINGPKSDSDLSSQKIVPLAADFHRAEMDFASATIKANVFEGIKGAVCDFDMIPGDPVQFAMKKCAP